MSTLPKRLRTAYAALDRDQRFAAVYRGKPGVVVRLRDSEFAWLCVSADDAQDVVARIRAAV